MQPARADIIRLTPDNAQALWSLRTLLAHYALHLRDKVGAEHICFPNFEAELERLPATYNILLLAQTPHAAAGCVVVKAIHVSAPQGEVSAPQGERACEMKRLWVEPAFRGSGLGRALVTAAICEARADGFDAVYLDTVTAAMSAARRLYLELGFQPVPRFNDNVVPGVDYFRLSLRSAAPSRAATVIESSP